MISSDTKKSITQVLITGVYRTGSEFLTQLINEHDEISATMYSVNMLRFMYNKYDPISKKENYTKALNDLAVRLRTRYSIEFSIEALSAKLHSIDNVSYGILYDEIMKFLYFTGNIKHWAEKNQLHWREIPEFIEMMPNGKAILIIRDPRSVLVSFKNYTYAKDPAYLGAIFNCFDSMKSAIQFEKDLPKDKFKLVKYEDLATDPEGVINKVWEFIGLTPIPINLNSPEWKDAYGKGWFSNSSFQDNNPNEQFDVEKSINRWKSNILDEDLFLAELVCGDLMKHYGYKLESIENVDWLKVMSKIFRDVKITDYFRNWLLNNRGIQEFPTDPTKPENWES